MAPKVDVMPVVEVDESERETKHMKEYMEDPVKFYLPEARHLDKMYIQFKDELQKYNKEDIKRIIAMFTMVAFY
jgi:hypothetical protein